MKKGFSPLLHRPGPLAAMIVYDNGPWPYLNQERWTIDSNGPLGFYSEAFHWFGIWETTCSLVWTGLLIRSYGETILYTPPLCNWSSRGRKFSEIKRVVAVEPRGEMDQGSWWIASSHLQSFFEAWDRWNFGFGSHLDSFSCKRQKLMLTVLISNRIYLAYDRGLQG